MKILLMIEILRYLKDSRLWELWYIPYYGVMQDLYHQRYLLVIGNSHLNPWIQMPVPPP